MRRQFRGAVARFARCTVLIREIFVDVAMILKAGRSRVSLPQTGQRMRSEQDLGWSPNVPAPRRCIFAQPKASRASAPGRDDVVQTMVILYMHQSFIAGQARNSSPGRLVHPVRWEDKTPCHPALAGFCALIKSRRDQAAMARAPALPLPEVTVPRSDGNPLSDWN